MTQKEKAEAIKKQLVVINELLKKPENRFCADCKKTSPTWASVNLGVFVCINCSGCHREIGVHITKIRSVNLDVWPKEVLNNFKIINNKIANKYWECKLKKFDFKKIQNDNYRLVEFIRDKYEHKRWVDPKKKVDPMTLIIKGKIKKYKKLFCEGEDSEEEEEEKEEKKKGKKKKKVEDDEEEEDEDNSEDNKKKNKKKNKKEESQDEDEEEEEKEEEEEEKGDKDDEDNKKNEEDDDDFEEIKENNTNEIKKESRSPLTQRPQQINNLFLDMNNNNNNNQNLLNLNNNNNNIVDIFSQPSQNNNKSQDLLNNINNAYFSPQPMHSSGFNNIFQQMSNNTKLNLQNKNNNFNNNMNINNNNNNMMNVNRVNSMQNTNMFNMNNNNNMNYGMNNNFNMNNMNINNNFNMNNNMNMNQNMNTNNNNNFNNSHPVSTTTNSQPSFNMEYFNKNMEQKKNNAGSTYNFSKNKTDPFANLVSFKK